MHWMPFLMPLMMHKFIYISPGGWQDVINSFIQVRRAMGFAFGAAGRAIYSGLVLWDSQVRLPPHLPD